MRALYGQYRRVSIRAFYRYGPSRLTMGAALGLALAGTLAALAGCVKGSRGDSLAINAA